MRAVRAAELRRFRIARIVAHGDAHSSTLHRQFPLQVCSIDLRLEIASALRTTATKKSVAVGL
jgi:hypothetical protein